MTIGGWIMLAVSWCSIVILTVETLRRSLRAPPGELSAPLDIEGKIEAQEEG